MGTWGQELGDRSNIFWLTYFQNFFLYGSVGMGDRSMGMGVWEWERGDGSVGMGAWGGEHDEESVDFFDIFFINLVSSHWN